MTQKCLYIIHNFKMLKSIEDVEKQIEKDIVNCFEVEKFAQCLAQSLKKESINPYTKTNMEYVM